MGTLNGVCVQCDRAIEWMDGNFATVEWHDTIIDAALVCWDCTDQDGGWGTLWELWRFKEHPFYLVEWAMEWGWKKHPREVFLRLCSAAHPSLARDLWQVAIERVQ